MNPLKKTLLAAMVMGASALAQAKTYVYDMTGLNSYQLLPYPGLDLNNVKSATLTVNRNFGTTPDLRSLEIIFPNAGKLRATNFKRLDDGRYRALVSGAWVFKEVIVQFDGNPDLMINQPANIQIHVSETTSNLNPEAMNQGSQLANVVGMLRDVTSLATVDTATATIDGKRVNLNLKDRLGMSATDGQQGFIIDTLWMGRGQKLMYIPAPIGPFEWDRIEVIGLTLEGQTNDPTVRVRYKETTGAENSLPPIPLRVLLQNTFPTP